MTSGLLVIPPGAVDRWQFVNRDREAPLPFEDMGNYARRAVTDRLNFTILGGVLSKLDINLSAFPRRRNSVKAVFDRLSGAS